MNPSSNQRRLVPKVSTPHLSQNEIDYQDGYDAGLLDAGRGDPCRVVHPRSSWEEGYLDGYKSRQKELGDDLYSGLR